MLHWSFKQLTTLFHHKQAEHRLRQHQQQSVSAEIQMHDPPRELLIAMTSRPRSPLGYLWEYAWEAASWPSLSAGGSAPKGPGVGQVPARAPKSMVEGRSPEAAAGSSYGTFEDSGLEADTIVENSKFLPRSERSMILVSRFTYC